MRWLCDENVPRHLVDVLRRDNHDVAWVGEFSPGIPDQDVLALAAGQRRICLTFDKDFGELAANHVLPADSGVVLVRIPVRPGPATAKAIVAMLNSRSDWQGHFSVLEPGRIRMRQLSRR
jgi:hypothetical protein